MKNLLSFLFISILFLPSCKQKGPTDKEDLPYISGNVGDVIVVCGKSNYNKSIQDTLTKYLGAEQYGLPQPEPVFNLIQVNPDGFEDVFFSYRNVIYIDIKPDRMSKGKMEMRKDVWARGQVVVKFFASSAQEASELIAKYHKRLTYKFNSVELERLFKKNLSKKEDFNELNALLKSKFGLRFTFQDGAQLAKIDSTTCWIRLERVRNKGGFDHHISQGLFLYVYPYKGKQQLTDKSLLNMRDYFLAKIPGPKKDSFITTEYKYVPPKSLEFNFKDRYAKEFRGLWEMENAYMGGPLYSIAVLDDKQDRIIGVAGYVYSPQFDKREFLREIEAVVKSMKFIE